MSRKKLNIIDIIIIVLVLACIVGVAFRYKLVGQVSEKSEMTNVEITILVEKVSASAVDAFKKGDAFYWEGINIGTLKDVTTSNASVYLIDENGDCVKREREDKYDVKIVLSASGSYTESGFMLSGSTYLAPGKQFEIYSLNVSTSGIILEIVEVSQ